jgi:hypothetical protein
MPTTMKAMLVGFCVMLASYSGPQSVKDARGDIDIFHDHMDTGNIDEIWQSGSADLTSASSKEEFAGFLAGLHEELGNVVESKQVGWVCLNSFAGLISGLSAGVIPLREAAD